MKIKAVCEETGLTDRAVRYYIDEGLIKPEFTENYVGRRSYDFTFEDISLISDISTRRNFGFTGFYACGIFAYNEETNNLRYSYCRGFDDFNSKSFVTPRYTQVEW